ncbi:MAG: DUF2975 domain-containing protein [Oscillospiraceae bacterium]|nr:DUF2975 domain-containing protein [Oscillospiraceae bacterium]
MKKPMEQLKEIMGVADEQPAANNTSKELKEVKRQIKNLLTVIKLIMALAIIAFVVIILSGIGLAFEYAVSQSSELVEEIYTFVQFAVTAAAVWYISSVCNSFCKDIDKSNTPFIPQVPKGLRKIATALVVLFFILIAAEAVYSGITHTEFNLNIDVTLGASVCILLLLSSIFDYGFKLQQESDETL